MSKTYKDQRRYDAKHYQRRGTHEPKDIHEPEWWRVSRFWTNTTQAKYWYRVSYRRLRHEIKQMLQKGRFDDIRRKPDCVDWIID